MLLGVRDTQAVTVIVGMVAPRGGPALSPDGIPASAGSRLAAMLGGLAVARINILQEGGRWRRWRARSRGLRLRAMLDAGDCSPIIVLGREAWIALRLPPRQSFLSRYENYYLIPHPSGRNRWYNSSMNRQRATALVRRLIRRET